MNKYFKKKSRFTRSAIAIAFSVAFAAPLQAAEFLDFVIDETPHGGDQLTVDKLNGGYKQVISFDDDGSFATMAAAYFGLFFADDGTDAVASQLQTSYSLYAIFSSTGETVTVDSGLTIFSASAGAYSLYLDPDQDSDVVLGATGSDAVSVTGAADDLLLASTSTLESALAILVPGIGGFFDLNFSGFSLTDDGADFFVGPEPFHIATNVDGDFDSFALLGTQLVTGDVSAVFTPATTVPVPAAIWLLGSGMIGIFGVARRIHDPLSNPGIIERNDIGGKGADALANHVSRAGRNASLALENS